MDCFNVDGRQVAIKRSSASMPNMLTGWAKETWQVELWSSVWITADISHVCEWRLVHVKSFMYGKSSKLLKHYASGGVLQDEDLVILPRCPITRLFGQQCEGATLQDQNV